MTPARSIFCPRCRAALGDPSADALRCSACDREVPVRDGIPMLGTDHDYYYAEIPVEAMEWFLDEARAGRTAQVFERPALEGPWSFLLGSHFDVTRGAWKYTARLPERHYERVLDFGCGWGVNALALAPHAREVVAMDLSWHRLANLQLLARTRDRDNVTVLCGGDVLPLPFPDDHFDLVALIGLIEWIPVDRPGNPRRHQLDFLREVRRIVKPGGEVYLSSENRYAYSYWLGKPDDHTALLFGSLLPRPLADLYSRLVRGRRYQHYTYSRRQYRRLFHHAGFPYTQFNGLVPSHRLFHKIFPLGRGRIVDRDERREGRLKDALLRTRLAASQPGAFGIRATPEAPSPSWAVRLCRALRERAEFAGLEPEPFRLVTTNFCVKASVRASTGDGVLARVPLTARKETLLANAGTAQDGWRRHRAVGRYVLPVTRRFHFEDVDLTVETLAGGAPGRPASAAVYDEVGAVLAAFAKARGTGSVAGRLGHEDFSALAAHLGPPHDALIGRLRASDRLRAMQTCWQHGDFHWENMLTAGARLARLVDWEWATPEGLPLADFFHLLVNDERVRFDASVFDVLGDAVGGTFPRPTLAGLAERARAVQGLSPDDVAPLTVAYLYDVLRQQWDASVSFGLGARFLPRPIRAVADAVPAFARDVWPEA